MKKAPRARSARSRRSGSRSAPRSNRLYVGPHDVFLRGHDLALANRTLGVPLDIKEPTLEQAKSVSTVWACIRFIAENLASEPLRVVRWDAAGRKEILDDHALVRLLNERANPWTPAATLREAQVDQALTHGNGFWQIVRSQSGRIVELRMLRSEWMAYRDLADGSRVYVYRPGADEVVLAPADVVHIYGPSEDGLWGVGIMRRAWRAIVNAYTAETYTLMLYAQGVNVGGIITPARKLDTDEREAFVRSLRARSQGTENSHSWLLLPPGAEAKEWSPPDAERMQMVEAQNFLVQELARYFRVPLHIVQVVAASQGWGKNLSELNTSVVRNLLYPWKVRIEQEMTAKLLSPQEIEQGTYVELDLARLERGDGKSLVDQLAVELDRGVITVNEWREATGRNDIGPAGDVHQVRAAPTSPPAAGDRADGPEEETDEDQPE
ncbi:phage portal protein, HK97 family [Anaeromyxobacter dehalogenans 2CP-1]|uniref:Phage portal protein, HK97 family n=1 Tax=Anaeromyxobacter dehalogenans (strain ATCC BAA-258 / DSM 21875 / 2CP-1) TaxID=455488 RepID=B8JGH6_ANAD2|nr:phage portal protein [Anaeromyxobacter dehalogenans]ACL64647.1 phage portal protein, HK97 family [Anaeromyxobacter dehalogenans 2CP-1]